MYTSAVSIFRDRFQSAECAVFVQICTDLPAAVGTRTLSWLNVNFDYVPN